ncbi:hypothetical protein MK489_02265 [Myxococcota bacterium]|nr:hypothetical protein [Myxococcota bacterium]
MNPPLERPRGRRQIPSVVRGAGYILWLVVFVIAVDYVFFYRPFVAELRGADRPEKLDLGGVGAEDPDLLRRVGALSTHRESSFVHFEPAPSEDILRVCAFGDSFTYGDEVLTNQDFPTQLGQRFGRSGALNVQVLNFGSAWHGFHQAFMLWKAFAHRYGCDYTLLGPQGFWPDRDTSFNHTDLLSPYFIHARYVLEDEAVRLVGVDGTDYHERFEHYWAFVPDWRYLYYDREPPAFLRALLPEGRTLRNPFYYRDDSSTEEAYETYRLLLREMDAAGMPVLLTHAQSEIVELARGLDLPNLWVTVAWDEHRFPYRSANGHLSSLGNGVMADQFYAQLVAGARPEAVVLVSSGEGDESVSLNLPTSRPLHHYEKAAVELGGRPLGAFVTASRDWKGRGIGSFGTFRDSGVVSVLALLEPGASLVDAAFLSLPFEIPPGADLELAWGRDRDAGGRRQALGTVRHLHPNLPLAVATVPEIAFVDKQWLRLAMVPPDAEKGGSPTVYLSDEPILRLSSGDGLSLHPLQGRLLQIAALRGPTVSLASLPRQGSYTLVLQTKDGVELRVPLAGWRKQVQSLPMPERAGQGPIISPMAREG